MRPGSDEEIAIVAGTMLDELWIKRLEEMGIDEIQGYWYSRPVLVENTMALLEGRGSRHASLRAISGGGI